MSIYDKSSLVPLFLDPRDPGVQRFYTCDDTQGFLHLLCTCFSFWMINNNSIPYCHHIGELLNNNIVRIHSNAGETSLFAIPCGNVHVKVSLTGEDANEYGHLHAILDTKINTSPHFLRMINLRLEGFKEIFDAITEMSLELESWLTLGECAGGCVSDSYKRSPYSRGARTQDDLLSIVTTGYCSNCWNAKIRETDPVPFESPFMLSEISTVPVYRNAVTSLRKGTP